MSISYSGLTSHAKVSLPSVSNWGTSNNIIRDPPKSITTRRIDKPSQTSCLTEEIDGSYDRICENIMYFARGVNPSVSVSYNNYGNATSNGSISNGTQASLPYKIMKDGAFVPPVFKQEDLLPLSRLRRPNTKIDSAVSFIDFTKKLINPECAMKTTGAKSAIPLLSYSTMATMEKSSPTDSQLVFIEPYIKNSLSKSANTNLSDLSRDTINSNRDVKTKNVLSGQYSTTASSDLIRKYEHYDDIHLSRTTPLTSATSNTSRDIYVKPVESVLKRQIQETLKGQINGAAPIARENNTHREKTIKPTISNFGGMSSGGTMPTTFRTGEISNITSGKNNLLARTSTFNERFILTGKS